MQDLEAATLKKALSLLARREHSTIELSRKLMARGIEKDLVASVVSRLRGKNLLSDARFAENFARQRIANGYGPVRIRHDLRERGIDEETARQNLPQEGEEWIHKAAEVRRKRFGASRPKDHRDRARQIRFLSYRGFTNEHIRKVLDGMNHDQQ
uniref:Regulatory protein RecX n=1 Tax=Candidatus Kentrum sp. LPFa TaxID=2126335 RepID=A0A450WTJ1_9GAMM|nr:MAG: regulatory protein [Candidatus Kentron sp. LPFa]VFK34170.1 MAG: regulatory protein [Candidatus Kentron sp. LPFa]